jgi:hypothetical protein
MDPSNLLPAPPRAATAGELLMLNGRQSGMHRPLGVPTTFIGSSQGCDVRLNVEGVEPFHCVLTYNAGELAIRDLNSSRGTFVNGQRITTTQMRDGDLLDVGPFRFRVLLPAPRPTVMIAEPPEPQQDAICIQAAAIAAQQAALDEQEAVLQKRQQEQQAEADRLVKRSAALDQTRSELQAQHSELAIAQVRLNTQREVDTRLLQDGCRTLQEDQQRWRQRRNRESMALRARRLLVAEGERKLADLRAAVLCEQQAWATQQHTLHAELHGVNNRIVNQRQLLGQQDEVRRALAVRMPESDGPTGPPLDAALAKRSAELDRVACELADQRAQLVEQWERLVRLHGDWEQRRDEAAGELETIGQRLARHAETLAQREQAIEQTEGRLNERQERMEQLRREAALALAKSQAQQQTWDVERAHVLAETNRLSDQARRQLEALGELRRNWHDRREQETEALRTEQAACTELRQELTRARQQLQEHARELETARCTLAEEAQALQDGTADSFEGSGPNDRASAPLRRRWLAQNAAVVRLLRQQRESFEQELATLAGLQQQLFVQGEQLAHDQAEVLERQTAVEYREAALAAGEARLEQEARHAEQHRSTTERRLHTLEEETEQLARALLPDTEPPAQVLERAA